MADIWTDLQLVFIIIFFIGVIVLINVIPYTRKEEKE